MKIKLELVKDFRFTGAKLTINNETQKVEDVTLFLTKNGTGAEHELIEIEMIQAVIKMEESVLWSEDNLDLTRRLLHRITKEIFDYRSSAKRKI